MAKYVRGMMLAAVIGMVVMTVGCGENEEMAMLRQNYQQAQGDLDNCHDQLAQMRNDRDRWHDQYLAARAENDALRGELAAVPEVPEGWTAVPGGAMIALDAEFLFNSGMAVLRKEAIPKIDEVVATIQSTYPDKEVMVYGHTDADPIKKSKWKDNWELSSQRALTVVRQLLDSGITGGKLVSAGCGEFQPIASNDTKEGRQQNRRVEIYVLDPSVKKASR
ncbi:MAG: OmpA family protein [Phycisphaerae bacterium]|nr:OmpA family protein [Phycisphaerae bacterium]